MAEKETKAAPEPAKQGADLLEETQKELAAVKAAHEHLKAICDDYKLDLQGRDTELAAAKAECERLEKVNADLSAKLAEATALEPEIGGALVLDTPQCQVRVGKWEDGFFYSQRKTAAGLIGWRENDLLVEARAMAGNAIQYMGAECADLPDWSPDSVIEVIVRVV